MFRLFSMRHMVRELVRVERRNFHREGTLGSTVGGGRTAPMQPFFVDQNGQKMAQFCFDVSGFKPEDVSVKTCEGRLIVGAKHTDKCENHQHVHEFHRIVNVPAGMSLESMRSRLAANGMLTIEAPYSTPVFKDTDNTEIPIHHEPPRGKY